MVETGDPVCAAATLFSMEDYTIIALTEPDLFHRLLEKHSRYIWCRTEQVAHQFPGRLWRIYGPEYVTEPYLPPRYFDEYVVQYTGPMVRMIQKHGGFVRIHSHGRIRNILDSIIAMGADATDPVEPYPQGDVDLKYVRERYGDRLVLFGNIEMTDIENLDDNEFAALIDKTLQDGTSGSGRGFVLMPTAAPYGRKITDQTLRNYRTLISKTFDFKL
jgi:uroporphyrinogen-III decarboxylase